MLIFNKKIILNSAYNNPYPCMEAFYSLPGGLLFYDPLNGKQSIYRCLLFF